ncbi:MAG: hypothetical protein KGD68_09785 [Candidatus Lokiarchaeota archaeon]|nr:hypothetical protein [Candidatus Lokiarchaeota archaeon]
MDIAKFNKELSYKINKANGLEKIHKYQEAVDLWLEISEMTLRVSKTPNLEFSYKSMLIDKTKQMIEHIKSLKQLLISQRRVAQRIEQKPIDQNTTSEIETNPTISETKFKSTPNSISENSNESETAITQDDIKEVKVVQNSDIQNLPIGFKEIETTEEFEIITPHDKDYVKKIISQDHNIDIFKQEEKDLPLPKRIEPDPPSDRSNIICFACGSEISSKSSKCPTCGTDLK